VADGARGVEVIAGVGWVNGLGVCAARGGARPRSVRGPGGWGPGVCAGKAGGAGLGWGRGTPGLGRGVQQPAEGSGTGRGLRNRQRAQEPAEGSGSAGVAGSLGVAGAGFSGFSGFMGPPPLAGGRGEWLRWTARMAGSAWSALVGR
jgi:hypothetical protein